VSEADLAGLAAAGAAGQVADHLAGRVVLPTAWQRALAVSLLTGPQEHRNPGLARQLLTGAGQELLRQRLVGDPGDPGRRRR